MRIATNITAMNTYRNYTVNNNNVAKAAEKLSSGYKINSAADDAAGLAITEKMKAQINGLNMASKNSQDAISLVQTAEGALEETQSMLQRMNELAVQSASGTNETFDRSAISAEFEQLKTEIDQISQTTTFNNMNILDGSLGSNNAVLADTDYDNVIVASANQSFVIGSKIGGAGTFTVTANTGLTTTKAGTFTLATGKYDSTGAWNAIADDTATTLQITFAGEDGTTTTTNLKLSDIIKGESYGTAGQTFTLDLSKTGLGTLTLQAGTAPQNTFAGLVSELNGAKVATTTGNVKTTNTVAAALNLKVSGAQKGSFSITDGGGADVVFTNTETGKSVTYTATAAANQKVDLTSIGLGTFSFKVVTDADGTHDALTDISNFTIEGNASGGALKIQVGALEGEQMELAIGKMDSEGLGVNGASIATQTDAGAAITATRNAVNTVSNQRALLGAMQNRLDHKINNLTAQSENLSAAESRIKDVDIAKEMTEYTKANILSQASTAMLAQANSAPQNVLSLLK